MPSAAIINSATPFKIGAYRRVNLQDDTEVKSQLASDIPVLVGLNVDQVFWKLYRGDQGKGIYSSFDAHKIAGQHALVLLGYDDEKRAYKVVNSWGAAWGSQGYGWIAYDTFHKMVKEGYVIQDDATHAYTQASFGVTPVQNPAVAGNQPNLQVGSPNLQMNVPVNSPLESSPE